MVFTLERRLCAAAILLSAAAASTSWASPPAKPDAPAAVATPEQLRDPVLSGPKVQEAERTRSLVKRDFEGRLLRLDMEPARAAVELLDLTPAERAEIDRILLERDALMDALITDHLREFAEAAGAFQSKDTAKGLQLLKPIVEASEPLRARGRLVKELGAALPAAKRDELERLTREYWKAAVADRRAQGGENGERLNGLQALAHEGLLVTGQELKRAYDRTIGSGAKQFETFIGKLSLTPEQESVVRREVGDLFQKTYGKPTKAQQQQVFWNVWKVLDHTQRKIVMDTIVEERRAEAQARQEEARAKREAAAPKAAPTPP